MREETMKKLMIVTMMMLTLSLGHPVLADSEEMSPLLKELLGSGELFRGLPERALRWQCSPATKFQCTKEGCEAMQPTVWVTLDFQTSSYSRCDRKGCDRYEMRESVSGIYTSVALVDRPGTLFKAVNDGSEFVEVITLGTTLMSSYGICSPTTP